MKVRRFVVPIVTSAMVVGVLVGASGGAAAKTSTRSWIQHVKMRGVTSMSRVAKAGSARFAGTEFNRHTLGLINRSLSRRPSSRTGLAGAPKVKANLKLRSPRYGTPGWDLTFQGLDHFDQRTANGGNQFSLEPPDQGLCVGNGYEVEVVNDALGVYNSGGTLLSGVEDLNSFYGYGPAINRTTGVYGPEVFDPSCYYDPENNRFIVVAAVIELDLASGNPTGASTLDIATSETGNPLGDWHLYSIPGEDDGTNGTPNHNCAPFPGPVPGYVTNPNACFPDFPHIGADAHGFYVTTNEYDFWGVAYHTAQIYALSKAALEAGTGIAVDHIDAGTMSDGSASFGLWPAQTNPGSYDTSGGGTEYFLSSKAAAETGNAYGMASTIGYWTLTNTDTLDTTPVLTLTGTVLNSEAYGIPPQSLQAPGSVPLAQCLNVNCLGYGHPPTHQVEGLIDSSDTRMFQVWYADGKLWSSLDTIVAVSIPAPPYYLYEAAVAWFVVTPTAYDAATLTNQGYLAAAPSDSLMPNSVIYPSIAMLDSGLGIMAFNTVGADSYPSQSYATMGGGGPADIVTSDPGIGPQDGFTEYFLGGGRPRWGDYSAAVTDGSDIWFAHEVINQTCTYKKFKKDKTCGGTRTALANWATQITKVNLAA